MLKRRDADEKLRKKVAKKRFTKLVRCVLMQIQWLADTEEQGMSLNVKKNVAMVFRQKHKSGALTANDRSLLRTEPSVRTVAERKKLCTLLGGMDCLSSLPPKVRARLVPNIVYMTVLPGKMVLREGDIPITLYFIVTGEVEIFKNVTNKVTKITSLHHVAILSSGDYFGDVAFLEDTVRAHTYITRAPTELLAVGLSAYNQILKPHLQKIWNEKKAVLKGLSYFSYFTFEQCVTACKYGTIHQYGALDPIYSDEENGQNLAHFVLSGECTILQALRMKVNVVNGVKEYELADVTDRETPKAASVGSFDVFKYYRSSSSDGQNEEQRRELRKLGLKEIERNCGILLALSQKSQILLTKVKKSRSHIHLNTHKHFQEVESYNEEEEDDYYIDSDDDLTHPNSDGVEAAVADAVEVVKQPTYVYQQIKPEGEITLNMQSEDSELFNVSSSSSRFKKRETDMSAKYETHFINVGSLAYGGIFGLGEHFEHRVILAKSQVQCLVLPRLWLYAAKQNPGNIWNRRKNYIDSLIPSRQKLFTNFLKTRSWHTFQNDYIESIVGSTKVSDCCKVEDIPIFGFINCE